jgi:cysteine-rich repeat protein
VLLLAAGARAADHPIAGDRLVLTDPPAAQARRVQFVARRDPGIDPRQAGDPRAAATTLTIEGSAPGNGAAGPIALDAAHWRPIGPRGTGWRWFDRRRATGVEKVVFNAGRHGGTLAVTGGGRAWPYAITGAQDVIDVRFTLGGDTWCAKFRSFRQDRRGRVIARRAPAPPNCTAGSNATCGNGVVDDPEECDDGNTTSGDGCSATCQLESATAVCDGLPTTPGTAIRSALVASGLARPTYVTSPPLHPNRLFVTEQPGRIRIVQDGTLQQGAYLDLRAKIVLGDEQGLLSLAFHPDFERNGFFYVNYTRAPDGATVVARYHADPTADVADPASEHVLFTIPQPFANHNGGLNLFGPDGALWVGMGDGGSEGDPGNRAQDDGTLLGKLLRVDLASETPAVFAKGLRNPWRFSFDRATGDLYIADVGQDEYEEVDVQAAPLASGLNYGWRIMEGRHCFDPPTGCDQTGLTLPVLEYCHDDTPGACGSHPRGCSITGGFVYRGCAMPDLRGRYFYADFCAAFIRSFAGVAGGVAQDDRDHTAELDPGGGRRIDQVSSFGEDARGELYVVDYGTGATDGELYRIVPR